MEDQFIVPVRFKGKELELPARVLRYAHTIKIEVEIEGTPVVFERDDEGNWRAVMRYEDLQAKKKPDGELVKAVIDVIDNVTR